MAFGIGARIFAVIGLFSTALIVMLGLNAVQDRTHSVQALEELRLSGISAQLIAVSGAMAVERGLINGQLADPSHVADALKAKITAGRAAQRGLLGDALAQLPSRDVDALASSTAALSAMCDTVDRAFAGLAASPRQWRVVSDCNGCH